MFETVKKVLCLLCNSCSEPERQMHVQQRANFSNYTNQSTELAKTITVALRTFLFSTLQCSSLLMTVVSMIHFKRTLLYTVYVINIHPCIPFRGRIKGTASAIYAILHCINVNFRPQEIYCTSGQKIYCTSEQYNCPGTKYWPNLPTVQY